MQPVKLVVVEDMPTEAEIAVRQLEAGGFACTWKRVDSEAALRRSLVELKPDLILSGVNHGENTSTNVLYSGTMSAAVEGAMENIPSIGFSLCDFDANADFTGTQDVARRIVSQVLQNQFPEHVCLNVNVPKLSSSDIKGIKVCKQAHAFWEDRFDKRLDQFGKPYYWLTGDFIKHGQDEDSDLYALEEGYATVVPTQFDMTAYKVMDQFKNWNL